MIKESRISWSAEQLTEAYNDGLVSLQNARQRGLCWKREQKSLLIHSAIAGYPIPGFYAVKDDGVYSLLDGKQRTEAIASYINNKYALNGDLPLVELKSGEVYDLNGKKFNDLPDELSKKINNRLLDMFCFDNASDDEIDDIFFRLNNGAKMDPIVMTCARAKCIEQINVAADHEIFRSALTASKLNKLVNKDIVTKVWLALNTENPSFVFKDIRKAFEKLDISDDSILDLWAILNKIQEIYLYINKNGGNQAKDILNNISKATHFTALATVVKQSITDNVSVNDLSQSVMSFFPGSKTASIDDEYNDAAKQGSSRRDNVYKRHSIIMGYYKATFTPDDGATSA